MLKGGLQRRRYSKNWCVVISHHCDMLLCFTYIELTTTILYQGVDSLTEEQEKTLPVSPCLHLLKTHLLRYSNLNSVDYQVHIF